jgi:hypothetical protein
MTVLKFVKVDFDPVESTSHFVRRSHREAQFRVAA